MVHLLPVKMSFEWLKQGCDFGLHNYAHHTWTKIQTIAYMKSFYICKSFFDKNIIKIIDRANHWINEYPSSWTNQIGLNQYLDTPMYLLFQGICNSFMVLWFSYFSKYKVRSKFIKEFNTIMYKLKSMNCALCRIDSLYEEKRIWHQVG